MAVLADALVTVHAAFPSRITRPFVAALLPTLPTQHATSSLFVDALNATSEYASIAPLDAAPLAQTLLSPSLLLLLGATVASLGAAVRIACFRALGPLFTFELTISPVHTLVTTGPYAWVRHPSYTGVYATLLGASAVMLAPGAWLREAWLAPSLVWAVGGGGIGGVRALLAWAFALLWATKVWYALKSTNKRVVTEDTELHRVFGAQWEEWAARTRWRLLPGVY